MPGLKPRRTSEATATTKADWGWRSGFLRSDAHKSVSISGRNDDVWVGGERHSGRYAPLENAGVLRCAQNDDIELTTAKAAAKANATAGPSTALLTSARAAPLRMTHRRVGEGEQTRAKAEADPYGMTNKRTSDGTGS